jgi:uncharacterized integral membrane protein
MAKIYEKIPGLGSGRGSFQVATRSRMYRGPDHLLIVQSTGYTEEYKRIFFRDIRYVEVRKTQAQLFTGIVAALVTLLLALLLLFNVPKIAVALFCLPFLTWFIVNLALGPTCECYIATNVQTLKIPTPRRMRKVTMLIGFLRAQTAAIESVETPQPMPKV